MKIGYDTAKNERNIRERGLSFDDVLDLDWHTAIIREDNRHDYGERRLRAFVYGGGKPYVVIYTRRDAVRWIISFRRAREEERKLYE